MEVKKSWGRKAWEIFQSLGAGAGIIALQSALSGAMSKAGQKAGEKIERKIEEALGLDIAGAEKTTDDESLFEKAIVDGKLSPTEKKAVWDYLRSLRKTNPMLAKEWVRWIHNTLVKFAVPVTINSGPADKKEIRKSTDYTEGIKIVESLLHDLASAPDDIAREAFLMQRNICVKETKPSPTVEKAKQFAKKTVEKVVETAKAMPVKELSEKIDKSLAENSADWAKKSSDFAAKQKVAYEAAKKSKK